MILLLILFHDIIANLRKVPQEHMLTNAYKDTRKKNNDQFWHIACIQTSIDSYGMAWHSMKPNKISSIRVVPNMMMTLGILFYGSVSSQMTELQGS